MTWFARWAGPDDVAQLTRDRMEDYLAHLQATTRPATVGARYRSLQQFFRWLVDEEELEASPLAKVARPKVPEIPVLVVNAVEELGVCPSVRPRRRTRSVGHFS